METRDKKAERSRVGDEKVSFLTNIGAIFITETDKY